MACALLAAWGVPVDSKPDGNGVASLLIEDAAIALGVSRRTIYYRIREGRLQTIRTRGGSQRVLIVSIDALRREELARRIRRGDGGTSGRVRAPAAGA
jgi:excisionase family DNA binding protein